MEKIISQFEKVEPEVSKDREPNAIKAQNTFVNDFPIERIDDLSLEDYLISPKDMGNDESFCYRIRYELECMSHMGDVRPDCFGIYKKGGYSIQLSKTFKNMYGSNYMAAFEKIKKLIVELLFDAEKENYQGIIDNKLNSSFKYKLLTVYYPKKFIPVNTRKTLDAYCNAVGLSNIINQEFIYKNIALREWKESVPEIENWSNYKLMRFCDWLWRAGKTIDGRSYRRDVYRKKMIEEAEDIEKSIESAKTIGETRDVIVKSRINQSIFRKRLLKKYGKCCLCAVNYDDLLIASHIKPWCKSDAEEKIDLYNGFLFCPNHDRLFDKGLISFDDDGIIMISKKMDQINQIFTNVKAGNKLKITLDDRNRKYLEYHRNYIFNE